MPVLDTTVRKFGAHCRDVAVHPILMPAAGTSRSDSRARRERLRWSRQTAGAPGGCRQRRGPRAPFFLSVAERVVFPYPAFLRPAVLTLASFAVTTFFAGGPGFFRGA